MQFIKYQTIENHYNGRYLKNIKEYIPLESQWIILEKIHGANFSIITNGDDIICCKRTGILKNDEIFFNYQKIIKKYKNDIIEIFQQIKINYCDVKEIQIYGEIFGGKYFDKKIKMCVQKEIQYHPDIEFMIYDIRINVNEKNMYLNYNDLIEIVCKTNLKFIPILFQGTFEDTLNYDVNFITIIPRLFGLPNMDNNFAEGIIIKPLLPIIINEHNIIIKKKNEKFSELKNNTNKIKSIDEFINRVIENDVLKMRINSIKSKYNEIMDKKKVTILIVEDIINEAEKIFDNIDKKKLNRILFPKIIKFNT